MRFLSRVTMAATAALMIWATPVRAEPTPYDFDRSHTSILFFISHLGFSQMVGEFHKYESTFMFDEKNPEKSTIDITIYPESVDTDSEALNKHLQTPDFFNVEKFPKVTFKSTSIKSTGDNHFDVNGDFTLLGVTKPLTLKMTLNKTGKHPMTQDFVAGFSGETTFKRSEFGMNNGLPMIGDDVRIHIEAETMDVHKRFEKPAVK